jgi:hypothetical protein
MDLWQVIFFDVFYLFIAVALFFQIRKGVRKEMDSVKKTIDLKKELLDKN